MTLLKRIGNKSKISSKIINEFPYHKVYIETFFGAGGIFFNKHKVKYNIVNDLDSDVYNLFQVIMNQKEDLEKAVHIMPIHSDLLNYWKKNKETEPIRKALRFLFLSNFTYLGKQDTIKFTPRTNIKQLLENNINKTFNLLQYVLFNNCDFEIFLNNISFIDIDFGKPSRERNYTFIYNDPPYIKSTNTYEYGKNWTENEFIRLLNCNIKTGCKFAISEFKNPFVINEAEKLGLNIIEIGKRQTLKNIQTEILITNYDKQKTLFD